MEHVTNSRETEEVVTIEKRWPESYYVRSLDGFFSVADAQQVLPALKALPENIATGATFAIVVTERIVTTVRTLTVTRRTIAA